MPTTTRCEGERGRIRVAARRLLILLCATGCFAFGSAADDPQRLFTEARRLQQKGDLRGAEQLYLQYLHLEPNSAEGHADLGIVLAHEGKLDSAIHEYKTALSINPSLHGVNLNLGIGYFRKNDYGDALDPLQKFLSVNPTNSQARELLGISYVQLDRYEEAIRYLAPLQPNGDPGVLYALAACDVRLGKMSEAENTIKSLLKNEPDSPRVHFLMGETYAGLNQFPQALEEFERVYAADPHWPQINFLLGAVEARLGKFAPAEDHLRAELRGAPQSFAARFALGALLSKQSNYVEAIRVLSEAHGLNPGDADTLYELARAEWKQGHVDEAVNHARQSVNIDAKNRQAHYLLGEIAKQAGDSSTANREFAIASSLSTSESEHDILRLTERSQLTKK
ncbi:MAG TPA: tetratricopeptide repeat protein [Terriglobia bacterium]|nr:tetratricopeptide repeat protein [Terriglobia bacterium]